MNTLACQRLSLIAGVPMGMHAQWEICVSEKSGDILAGRGAWKHNRRIYIPPGLIGRHVYMDIPRHERHQVITIRTAVVRWLDKRRAVHSQSPQATGRIVTDLTLEHQCVSVPFLHSSFL